jgi:hypothetical protein
MSQSSFQRIPASGIAKTLATTNSAQRRNIVNSRQSINGNRKAGRAAVPTPIQTQPRENLVVRYISGSSTNVQVATQNLLGVEIAVANTTTGTAGISTLAAFRIKRVKVWGINDSSTANVNESIGLTWIGAGGLGLSQTITSSGSDALPSYISSEPPPDSECGWWHNYDANQTQVLFALTGLPTGAIVDIHLEVIRTGQADYTTTTSALAGTTQLWVVPSIKAGLYRQQIASTLGGTVILTPQSHASLAPTSQSIV